MHVFSRRSFKPLALALAWSLTGAAGTAVAQEFGDNAAGATAVIDSLPSDVGTVAFPDGGYCSAVAFDGNWGFGFGRESARYQCDRVRYALYAVTTSPISGWDSGYYRGDDYNEVYVRCRGYSASYTGFGVRPLQDAYRSAYASGTPFCTFRVF